MVMLLSLMIFCWSSVVLGLLNLGPSKLCRFQQRQRSSHQLTSKILPSDDYEEWWKRSGEDEEIVIKLTDRTSRLPDGFSFIDANDDMALDLYGDTSDKFQISELTLRDISETYHFSLSYLGDFVVQLGCKPPIDVDTKIGNVLMGEQIFSLLQALNSLDPAESHCDYDSTTPYELADELDISLGRMLKICQNEQVNLPFGFHTVLHKSVVAHIRDVYDYDEYVESELDSDIEINEYGERLGFNLN